MENLVRDLIRCGGYTTDEIIKVVMSHLMAQGKSEEEARVQAEWSIL